MNLFILACAGALGTVARYVLGGWVNQSSHSSFPFGTFVVNAAGCLAIGFLGTLADEKQILSPDVRAILFLGFLGAFTTFSSFAYETWVLMKDGNWVFAGLNILGSLLVCFVVLYVGVVVARLF